MMMRSAQIKIAFLFAAVCLQTVSLSAQERRGEEGRGNTRPGPVNRGEVRRPNPAPAPGNGRVVVRPSPAPGGSIVIGPRERDNRVKPSPIIISPRERIQPSPPIYNGNGGIGVYRPERARVDERYRVVISKDLRNREREIVQYRETFNRSRMDWRTSYGFAVRTGPVFYAWHSDSYYWDARWTVWHRDCVRPVYPSYAFSVSWHIAMPVRGLWNYQNIETVAYNIEHYSREVYAETRQKIDRSGDGDYPEAQDLLEKLSDLEDAAENYTNALYDRIGYNTTLDDLFYLDHALSRAENSARSARESGFSFGSSARDELSAMRYYVNELLWQYRRMY